MRIHHVTWLPDRRGFGGVLDKLGDLGQGARQAGIELQVHILTAAAAGPQQVTATWPRWAAPPLRRLMKSASLERFIQGLSPGPVVLRYPGAIDLAMPWLLARVGDRLVTEHHTNEAAELSTMPLGALRAGLETLLQPAILGRVRGCVAMTDEIAGWCRAGGARVPTLTLANGVAPERFMAPPRHWAGGTLRVLMVAGVFWPWQGLDRILRGLLSAPDQRIELHLAGLVRSTTDQELIRQCNERFPGQVIAHGNLAQPALDALATETHLAISSLALHRKRMTEACPIKSREYCARGIPFIKAYHDPDFPAGSPGCYTVAADDAPLTPGELRRIAKDAWGHAGLGGAMREHTLRHLDFARKSHQLVDYLHSLGTWR